MCCVLKWLWGCLPTHTVFPQEWFKSFSVIVYFGSFSNTALVYEWQQAGGETVNSLVITWVQGSVSASRHSYPHTWTNLLTDTSWPHSSGHGHFVSPATALWAVMVMSGSDSGLLTPLLASGQVATCHAVPHNVPARNAHYFQAAATVYDSCKGYRVWNTKWTTLPIIIPPLII